ncbi:MAG: hypothetical protein COV45_01105 [Deltaproteobacteria bacterium CG11_big_fil_rev_8_21_14_0_20_47_16]|nr:MAG: hypothetical protein COV45_01105 [Deltaproteobacteria bacterium CG11_big_fil_rev_8_21_14_0_20_47_16]
MWKKWAILALVPMAVTACSGSNYAGKGSHHRYDRNHAPQSDIPLVVNDRVTAWVDYFSGPGKERFGRYMQRSGRYEPMIRQIMKSYGMPQDLMYLAMIESGFSSKARSHASAVGVWQFIRSTGNRYGLDQDMWIEERQDAEKETHAAAQYLKDLYSEFNDWYLAMAAYNAGEGTVRRAIAKYGSKDFWVLSDPRKKAFRAETRDYVPKFIAAAIIGKNPERFGFHQVKKDNALNFELVTVDTHVDVDVIAKCAGTDVETVDILNSELRVGTAPPRYKVRIPPGSAKKFHANLSKIDPKDRVRSVASLESHTVKKGETLSRIARRYGVKSRSILSANRLKSARNIKRGMVISIPVNNSKSNLLANNATSNLGNNKKLPTVFFEEPISSKSQRYHRQSTKTLKQIAEKPDESIVSVTTAVADTSVGSGYVVSVGDSWNSISQNLGIETVELKRLNPEAAESGLYVGDVLKISVDAGSEKQVADNTDVIEAVAETVVVSDISTSTHKRAPTVYRVKRGDSLGKIANRYGVSVSNIREWNGLAKGVSIRPGQKLRVSPLSSTRSAIGRTSPGKVAPQAKSIASTKKEKVVTYKVKPGDNLWTIGKRHNMSASQIRQLSQANKKLRPGDVLTLRTGS